MKKAKVSYLEVLKCIVRSGEIEYQEDLKNVALTCKAVNRVVFQEYQQFNILLAYSVAGPSITYLYNTQKILMNNKTLGVLHYPWTSSKIVTMFDFYLLKDTKIHLHIKWKGEGYALGVYVIDSGIFNDVSMECEFRQDNEDCELKIKIL